MIIVKSKYTDVCNKPLFLLKFILFAPSGNCIMYEGQIFEVNLVLYNCIYLSFILFFSFLFNFRLIIRTLMVKRGKSDKLSKKEPSTK